MPRVHFQKIRAVRNLSPYVVAFDERIADCPTIPVEYLSANECG